MRRFLQEAEERLGAVLLILLLAMVLVQIFSRTVGWTIVWTEESSRFLFIWIILLGVSAGIQHGSHIGTDLFVHLLPRKYHRPAAVMQTGLFLLFTAYMAKLSISLLMMQMQFPQYAPATGFPGYIISAALPIGFIATSIRLVARLNSIIRAPGEEDVRPAQ